MQITEDISQGQTVAVFTQRLHIRAALKAHQLSPFCLFNLIHTEPSNASYSRSSLSFYAANWVADSKETSQHQLFLLIKMPDMHTKQLKKWLNGEKMVAKYQQ